MRNGREVFLLIKIEQYLTEMWILYFTPTPISSVCGSTKNHNQDSADADYTQSHR